MPLLTVENLTKYYDTELLLDHVAFSIDHRERLGLIGANGTGKTTLYRILLGREPCEDDSRIHIARGATFGLLSQDTVDDSSITPWQMVMSVYRDLHRREQKLHELTERMAEDLPAERLQRLLEEHAQLLERFEADGGYEYEQKAARVLTKVGVPEADFHRELGSFSGGEQRRAALARLLLQEPDLLLLDEPTNHLDVEGIEWLEQYLRSYPGAVIAVSHDRRFLDAFAQRILEIEACDLNEYKGGYTDYMRQKEERLLVYERQYEQQQRELKKQMSFIRWALGTQQEKRVKAAKSRLKLLEKTEFLDPPLGRRRKMSIRFQPRMRGGEEILDLQGVGKQYGDHRLFVDLDLFVRRGDRLGIMGPNGCGKTTLLRIMLGLEEPSAGRVRRGASVTIGYYRQQHFDLNPENTVIDDFATVVNDAENDELRSLLARFLFVEEDVFKRVGDLSGGEQSRLSLAKLVMTRPTLLVLDEPTNHLDIDSRNALENALKQYTGTIIVVTHDRYFLDSIVNRLLIMREGQAVLHEGNYSSYIERCRAQELEAEQLACRRQEERRKEHQLREKAARKARENEAQAQARQEKLPPVEQLEARAHELETSIGRIEQILANPATYDTPEYVNALSNEHTRLANELETVYDLWERAEKQAAREP